MVKIKESSETETSLNKFLKSFQEISKNPETFLSIQPKKVENIKLFLKELYDYTTQQETECSPEILPELQVEDLDDEQIWQQLELKNDSIWGNILQESSRILSLREESLELKFKSIDEDTEESLEEDSDINEIKNQESAEAEESDESEDEEVSRNFNKKAQSTHKIKIIPSIVDDNFFKLSELEAFLNAEDKNETSRQRNNGKLVRSEDDEGEEFINYFEEDLEEEVDENDDYRYEDFFDEIDGIKSEKVNEGKDYFAQEDEVDNEEEEEEVNEENENEEDNFKEEEKIDEISNENDEGTDLDEQEEINLEQEVEAESADEDSDEKNNNKKDEIKSSFEQRQERLRLRINDLEEKALSEKPWQLKGEIAAKNRPHNSLLEEVLEYDSNVRPAPVITEKTNQTLEEIIRQRILDKSWDDVELTIKPVQTPHELRKKLILDQEKSKESLAQIYEKEYQKEVANLDIDDNKDEEEPKEHKEIKKMMKDIFKKLDALSNFHFVPKPVAPEPRIITNTPAVQMEEVAPIMVSDAKLLAPQEVKAPAKGEVLGKSERTKTDKNRERRHKKLRQKSIYKAKEKNQLEKQSKGIGLTTKEEKQKTFKNVIKNRNVSKMTESSGTNSVKTSKAFFTQLQENVSGLKMKRKKDGKSNESNLSAKKLKL